MSGIVTIPATIPATTALGQPFSYTFISPTLPVSAQNPAYEVSGSEENYSIGEYNDGVTIVSVSALDTNYTFPKNISIFEQTRALGSVFENEAVFNVAFSFPAQSSSFSASYIRISFDGGTTEAAKYFLTNASGSYVVQGFPSSFPPPALVSVFIEVYIQGQELALGFSTLTFTIGAPIIPATTFETTIIENPGDLLFPYTRFTSPSRAVVALPYGFLEPTTTSLNFSYYDREGGFYDQTYTLGTTYPDISLFPAITPLYIYQPFSNTFSVAPELVGVYLAPDPTSDLLSLFGPSGLRLTFSSTTGLATPGTYSILVNTVIDGVVQSTITNTLVISAFPITVVSSNPPIISSSISLYRYEAFETVFSIVDGTTTALSGVRSSATLQNFITLTNGNRTLMFSGTPLFPFPGVFTLIVDLLANDGTILRSLTYTVTFSNGRIQVDPLPPYSLYQYENISNTLGKNITFIPGTTVTSIVAVPSLPPGLLINTTSISSVASGPTFRQAQKNYQLIGSNSSNGRIVTTTIAIKINPPRIVITASDTLFSSVTTTSTPRSTITAMVPTSLSSSGSFFYMWSPGLPSGLVFKDVEGNSLPTGGPFYPPSTDTAKTMLLDGTPDMTDARSFPSSGLVEVVVTGYYSDGPSVQTNGSITLRFQFARTILMTAFASPTLYERKPLVYGDVILTAATYFPSGPVSTFTADALPAGLAISAGSSPYYLQNTPTVAGTGVYTFTATNVFGDTKSIPLSITINPDVVTFIQPADQVFIVSRPLSGLLFFRASATSGSLALTYASSLDFAPYGLTLNSTTGKLSGTPTAALIATAVTISATDEYGAIGFTTFSLTISSDTFTFPITSFAFFQNRAITPYQFVVTTVSGRPIQSFSSTNLPAGLTLSPLGLLTGTPTEVPVSPTPSFTIAASTGYQLPPVSSSVYSYSVKPDNFLILQVNGSDAINLVFSNIQFQSIQYSTGNLVNPVYSIGNVYPAQVPAPSITITSSGSLSGDFTGVSPLYPSYTVDITATSSGVTSTTPLILAFNNPAVSVLLAGYGNAGSATNVSRMSSTTSNVFGVNSFGSRTPTDQVWTPYSRNTVSSLVYPMLAQNQDGFIAVSPNLAEDGVYNPTTRQIEWTPINLDTDPDLPVSYSFLNVASDGSQQSVLLVLGEDFHTMKTCIRYGTDPWMFDASVISNINTGQPTTFANINGNYVFGQYGFSDYPNIRFGYVYDGSTLGLAVPATLPEMSNVLRFGTSNTTLVAVGSVSTSADPTKGPLSLSTDYGYNWTSPTLPSFMRGSTVVLNDILYAANTWVTCGLDSNGANFIAYSSTPSNWVRYTNLAIDSTIRWSGLAFNGNAWTVAGAKPSTNETKILSLFASAWPNQTSLIGPGVGIQFGSGGTPLFSRILSKTIPSGGSSTGTAFIAQSPLSFSQPTQGSFTLYQYVPYRFNFTATGSAEFIYYYGQNVPVGFAFNPETTGVSAELSGISPSNNSTLTTIYAKTATSAAVPFRLTLNTIIPFFVNPQSGAGAYTAILREHVDADAAQNARDNKVFPEVNPLAGPFMAPRAPDVLTMSNCFLSLCKKPCPNCKTMM